jgi:hypothetical protein
MPGERFLGQSLEFKGSITDLERGHAYVVTAKINSNYPTHAGTSFLFERLISSSRL